jgi:hypothetical protein
MNERVESLWEDTDNLQNDMAKVMVLVWANKGTTTKMLQSVTSLEATAAALVEAVNDLIPVVWCQGALLQDMQCDHVKFWQDTLPILTLTVCQCNTMLEELQWDQVKLWQTISNVHHHVMSQTMPPPPVVLGMSTNVGSGACNQPLNTVLVCEDESGAPVELHRHPRNNVAGDREEALGTMHVWHLPPCKTVSFDCEGGPVVTREFVSFGCGGGTVVPRDLGATKLDICSHPRHPLFPQVNPSTFNNLVERGCTHVNTNALAKDGVTDPTTWVGTTTTTQLDNSRSPFRSALLDIDRWLICI